MGGIGIGIVSNPLAWRNRRAPGLAARLRDQLGAEGELLDAATPAELDRALARFRQLGVEVLGILGGDGTAHVVLSAAVRAWEGAPLPPVALLRGGAMNTVADAHELRGGPEALLRALLDRRRAGSPLRTVERDLLGVETDGEPPRHGFIFGTGAAVVFLDAYYRARRPGRATAARLLLRAVGSALTGGPFAAALMGGEPLRITADGEEWPEAPFIAVLAGAVPEIGFGFAPFSRCDEQPGFFHAVGVTGTTLQVAVHLPQIWWGRPWRRSLAVDGVTRDLFIDGPVRFNVDGDLYEARRSVRIRTGPAVRLVVP